MCLMSSAAMTLNLHKSPLKLVSPGAIARCWTLVAASGSQPNLCLQVQWWVTIFSEQFGPSLFALLMAGQLGHAQCLSGFLDVWK